jgi:poly(A) polymerase
MKKTYKLYKVGGCVRDALLGLKSKDIDFTFEFSPEYIKTFKEDLPSAFYTTMNDILSNEGFEIFLEVPEAFTTRARFPGGHKYEKLTADFVLARKETYPNPETRMPVVEIGTLYDDLKRRDFTVNAIAEDEDGNLIDPFDGQGALKYKLLRCPVDAETSFNNDPLRMLRALRFSITKKLFMSQDILKVIRTDVGMWDKFSKVVSQERIREEIFKMMKHNTVDSMGMLVELDRTSGINVLKRIFENAMWLKPTTEKK